MSLSTPRGLWIAMLWLMSTSVPLTAAELPFKIGEKLTYHFYWGIFMVGQGTFEVSELDKDNNYVFIVHIKSNAFVSTIYPVEDVITSIFDPVQKRSVRFLQDRKEGNHRTSEEILFFHETGQGSTESYLTKEKKSFQIPKGKIQDKLSLIYYMRCLSWKSRTEASVIIGNDKKNYEVKIKKLKTETIELDDFQPIPTFQVEPSTEYLSGFVKKGKMFAWVSDDTFKVPVRVISKLPIGTISAVLIKVEGIKDWPYQKQD